MITLKISLSSVLHYQNLLPTLHKAQLFLKYKLNHSYYIGHYSNSIEWHQDDAYPSPASLFPPHLSHCPSDFLTSVLNHLKIATQTRHSLTSYTWFLQLWLFSTSTLCQLVVVFSILLNHVTSLSSFQLGVAMGYCSKQWVLGRSSRKWHPFPNTKVKLIQRVFVLSMSSISSV